ncbi:DUF1189 family protein [Chungangia koreensis]|uniref:DUF1189 family protein n=1 Tax=Chungangia koreensis TaxID=752657 RepID=A0ABV8X8I7_9LACT
MGIFTTYKYSLSLPKRKSVLALNKTKQKDFFLYILFLLLLFLIPNGIRLLQEFINEDSRGAAVMAVLFLYPFMSIFAGLAGISAIAGLGVLINDIAKRHVRYMLLWRMAVFAMTIPLTVFTLLDLLGLSHWVVTVLLFGYFFFIYTKMILGYPRKRT